MESGAVFKGRIQVRSFFSSALYDYVSLLMQVVQLFNSKWKLYLCRNQNREHKQLNRLLLQRSEKAVNRMLPRKKALYADQLLYVPVILGFHKILCTSIIKNELLWVQHCHCIIKSFESHTNKSNAISFKCWDRLIMP